MTDTTKTLVSPPKDFMAEDRNHISAKVMANLIANKPVLLEGDPGTGKTAWIHQLGYILGYWKNPALFREDINAAKFPVEVIAGESMNPEDFTGYPVLKDNPDGSKSTFFATPAWAQRMIEADKGILFLDELRNFPPDVHASLLKIIQDRRLPNGVMLPQELRIIAAQNSIEHSPNGTPLAAPLANRFAHFAWSPSPEVWINGVLENWNKPVTDEYAYAASLVVSFINQHRDMLLQVPTSDTLLEKPYPTWRSWQNVIDVLAANPNYTKALSEPVAKTNNADRSIASSIVEGFVGEAVMSSFLAAVNGFRIPTYKEMINNPSGCFDWQGANNSHSFVALKALIRDAQIEDNDAIAKVILKAWEVKSLRDVVTAAIREFAKKMLEWNAAHPNEEAWKFSKLIKSSEFGDIIRDVSAAFAQKA